MKLVFLYGPPGVGKLTVAKELSKLTGYKVFHNHATIDMVKCVFNFDTAIFWDFVNRYRLELLEAAARENVPGLITTLVYCKDPADETWFLRDVIAAIEPHGGEVLFVRLTCDFEELKRRLKSPTRRAYNKMTKITQLRQMMQQTNIFADVPYARNLTIDNTKLSARKTAAQIAQHYGLEQV
jgi:shikimate kinase